MNTAAKTFLMLLVLTALGWTMFHFVGASDTGEGPPGIVRPEIPDDNPTGGGTEIETADSKGTRTAVGDPGTGNDPIRKAVNSSSGGDLPQGAEGRVLSPTGAPLAGVDVVLRKVPQGGLFGSLLAGHQGLRNPPLASSVTGEDGAFRLGLRKLEGAQFELLFLATTAQDKKIPSVKLYPDEWTQVGDVRLERGAILFGRVTDKETGAPIAGASVFSRGPMAPTFGAPPGREQGIETITDAGGGYRFENLAPGAQQMHAVAKGYAQVTNLETRTQLDAPIKRDFALPEGREISGFVTDPVGNGIPSASVDAVCLSTKTPMRVQAKCDDEGRFVILGLVDAPFQLSAKAPGFLNAVVQPVDAGATNQQIVLEAQGGARIRVLGKNGRVLKNFHVRVLRHYQQNDTFGAAHEVQPQQVSRRDLDGDNAFLFTGLNPGRYAFELEVKGFAKTRSDSVQVEASTPPTLVTATMKIGGVIEGTVFGPDGTALAGVQVSTMQPGLVEVPFISALASLMTTEITKTSAKTNGEGRYRLTNLAAASYQLKYEHPSAFVKYRPEVVVGDEQTTEAEVMRLERGTQVWGRVHVDGQLGVGVKITIATATPPGGPGALRGAAGQNAFARFSANTLTDEKGEFVFGRRVPPGRYTMRAGRTLAGNPMMIMLDFKKTEQEVTLNSQDTYEYSPNILSN